MLLKRYFRDSATYGIGQTLSFGLSLVLVPLYTRFFHPGQVGMIDLLQIVLILVNLLLPLEISIALARLYPDTLSRAEKIGYASTSLWFTVFTLSLFLVLAIPNASFLSTFLFQSSEHTLLVQIAAANIWAFGLFYWVGTFMRYRLQSRWYITFIVLNSVLTVGLFLSLVALGHRNLYAVFVGQLVANFVCATAALFVVRDDIQPILEIRRLKEMLLFSVPLVPSSIGVFVALYVDRIAVKELLSIDELGVFGIAYRFAAVTGIAMSGFQTALTPLVFSAHRNDATPQELAGVFRFFVGIVLILGLSLIIFTPELLAIFVTKPYYSASRVIPILVPAVLLFGMYPFAPGLILAKKTVHIAWINGLTAATNATLCLVLVPRLGLQGAATASLITALGMFSAFMVFSQKLYPVPHSWKQLLAAVVWSTAIGVTGTFASAPLWTMVFVKGALVALALLILFRLKIFDSCELRELCGIQRKMRLGT